MRDCRGRLTVLVPLLTLGLLASAGPSRAEAVEGTVPLLSSNSLVGSYLAGRFARSQFDTREAADFYRTALVHDPKNAVLLEQAFQIEAGRGDWVRAVELAEQLVAIQDNHRLGQLALALKAFNDGAWKKAETHFKAAGSGPIGELTSAMALAWVALAKGDTAEALSRLDLPKQAEWAQFFLRTHRAMIADLSGRRSDARTAYDRVYAQDTRTLRTSIAYARHLARTGDRRRALVVVNAHIERGQGDGHPLLRSLKASLEAGRTIDPIVKTPSEGLAEVFYGLGEALIGEGATGIGIIYMQMALFIEPEHQFALAALASAYEANKQYSDAIAVYDRIPNSSPLATAVEIRKAFNLNSLEKVDEARAILANLLEDSPAKAEEPPKAEEQPAVREEIAALSEISGQVLRRGARGEPVKKLQVALEALGYDIGASDGTYGEGTRQAVMAFQRVAGLKADGVAGPGTLRAMLAGGASGETGLGEDGQLPITVSDRLEILDALGNILRSRKLYEEAIPYYDQALALVDKPERRHWVYFYARGTSYERIKDWPKAEVDLKKALELYPDQPLVLNYLGYSWVDQGSNLDKGMKLIEKAVALKPDDGYIVDSLGWAHYKQGNFEEAVRYLERAVELRPEDPILNDHLGDALWRVGREREARFQWDQALTLDPEPDDAVKIRQKLEAGLTAPVPGAGPGKQAAKSEKPGRE